MSGRPIRVIAVCLLATGAWAQASGPDRSLADLERRAASGDAEAQITLGTLYEAGDRVAKDVVRAAALYRKAARAGSISAQINIATLLLDGQGVRRDPAEAVTWLRQAATRGNGFAQLTLGSIYEAGDPPVARDEREAAAWYRRAAGQGLVPAQYLLARMYEDGRGVTRDLDEAAAWYRKAADHADPAAQFRLGLLMRPGNGPRTDIVEAHKWLNLAASRWQDKEHRIEAAKQREALEATMTDGQISDAIRRSLRWQDTVEGSAPRATALKALPEPTSSFGAAEADGWLYVYGGHVSPTHAYSTSAVSGHFARRRLSDGGAWETLPAGPPAQGLSLAAYKGRIYRVGGMQPRNEPGAPSDTHSLDAVARFDPATRTWEALPPLPAARSSHDVVMVGNRLFVLGGWNLRGRGGSTEWPATMEILDLAATRPIWTSVPQPFKRRALVAAAHGDRIYVIGGFDDQSKVVRGMDVYDAARGTWSAGPALPGGPMNGFGPAAAVVDGRLVVSVDDGSLHRLRTDGAGWEPIGQASPRIAHRLVTDGDRVLILGGARAGANLDLVESLAVGR